MTRDHIAHEHQFRDEFGAPGGVAQERLVLRDLADINLEISADLGNCTMLVRDVLGLKRGSVVPLNKLAGEMADIYVNGVPLAKGEVMVMGDSLQLRIAEINGATEKDTTHLD